MRRYTTPIESLTIDGIDLTEKDVYVTLVQGNTKLNFSGTDLEMSYEDGVTTIEIHMTQAQTASFSKDDVVKVEVNWMDGNERNATEIAYLTVHDNLYDEVIE